MDTLKGYWNSIGIWRKAFYVSILGTAVWFVSGLVKIISVILKNNTGNYQCAISVEKPCTLAEFILKSDDTILFYISIILVFIVLLIITNSISFLFHLYRKQSKKWFWIVFAIILIFLITFPFIFQFLIDIL